MAKTFRMRRLCLGMTQTKLAKTAGVATSMICEIEKGKKKPSWKALDKLLSALKINFWMLNEMKEGNYCPCCSTFTEKVVLRESPTRP